MLSIELLDIIACPICQGKLKYEQKKQELHCLFDKLAFPIQQGIPIMLESEARKLNINEVL